MVSAEQIFANANLEIAGSVPWGKAVPLDRPGVYLVATTEDITATGSRQDAEISREAVGALLTKRPEVTVDRIVASLDELTARLAALWVFNEPVLYIGMSTKPLRKRVGQYVRHRLGANGPHKGGWPLKVLAPLDECWVHFAPSDDPGEAERLMLEMFAEGLPASTIASLYDPDHPMPFANLEYPKGTRKRHGIKGASST